MSEHSEGALALVSSPLSTILRKLLRILRRPQYPVKLHPRTTHPRGHVLFSYLENPLRLSDNSSRLKAHSNQWESREIARIFVDMGYQVDAVNWSDAHFVPTRRYEIFFDISTNLARLSDVLDADTLRILHRTGSDPYYTNLAEKKRVWEVNRRRNGSYVPKRAVENPQMERKSLRVAHACSLLGNEHTLNTYPKEDRTKIQLVTVSASELGGSLKTHNEFVPEDREFLWFFGAGAVHKGLDLVLEAFGRHPNLILHVVGDAMSEPDFTNMYHRELKGLPNIRYHGPLPPNGREFTELVQRVYCFVAPSCSEGISPAVATCLQIGLYPIISHDTGVSLPEGFGKYLPSLSVEQVEAAILSVHRMSSAEIAAHISETQNYALDQYSRKKFRLMMENFISKALSTHGRAVKREDGG